MPTPAILQAIGLHLIGPFAVSLLLFQLFRKFRSAYLLQWTLGFACLTLFHVSVALLIVGNEETANNRATLIAASAAGAAAA